MAFLNICQMLLSVSEFTWGVQGQNIYTCMSEAYIKFLSSNIR